MIDVETDIINAVKELTSGQLPARTLQNAYVRKPATFPHATLREIDNSPVNSKSTTDNTEEYATLTYELNVYSNTLNGKHSECRRIANILDEALKKLKFRRISLRPTPNLDDATIERMTGRYEVTVDKNRKLY